MTTDRRRDPADLSHPAKQRHPGKQSDPPPASPQALGREIAETRDALAETLSALLYKADLKARARERIAEKAADTRAKVRSAMSHRGGAHRKSTMDIQHPHESWHGIEAVRPRSGVVLAGVLAAGVGAVLVVAVIIRRLRP